MLALIISWIISYKFLNSGTPIMTAVVIYAPMNTLHVIVTYCSTGMLEKKSGLDKKNKYINCLVEDCSICITNKLEILQSCNKLSIYYVILGLFRNHGIMSVIIIHGWCKVQLIWFETQKTSKLQQYLFLRRMHIYLQSLAELAPQTILSYVCSEQQSTLEVRIHIRFKWEICVCD